jgi:hypothetical protein
MQRPNSCGDGRLGRQRSEATPTSQELRLTHFKIVILSEARHWQSQWLAQSKDLLSM